MISRNERRKNPRPLQNARLIASGSTVALFGILFTAAYTRPTNRNYSGRFVLRAGPEMHRVLAVRAISEGDSLNSFVIKSLKKAVLGNYR